MSSAAAKNHKMHEDHYQSSNRDMSALYKKWTRKDTTDYWRHSRMYQLANPLIKSDLKASWLTVGDGRFGKDANYIQNLGAQVVLATDIDDSLLKIGKEKNFIRSFKQANAENLPLKDDAYDYILCKESFHHFPRPMIALYEMLRVAKKAVILIEPYDIPIKSSPIARIKNLLHPSIYTHINKYEESGNFVYGIGKRELEKVALGIDLPAIAYAGIDDHHIKGVESEVFSAAAPLAGKIKRKIKLAGLLKKLKLRESSIMACILFKETPSKQSIESLKTAQYEYRKLPRNPYLK